MGCNWAFKSPSYFLPVPKCSYEKRLLLKFDGDFFLSDALQVNHHGSSSGTGEGLLEACSARHRPRLYG